MPINRKAFELFALDDGIEGSPVLLDPAKYVDLGALEPQHIERWIRERPDLVGEELKVVTNQFAQFKGSQDRLDVLAIDRDGRLVVIEVKRDTSGSYQDLQALRYAAFVSTFRAEQLVDAYREYVNRSETRVLTEDEARTELESFTGGATLDAVDDDEQPRIILVAGAFEAGVTSTVLWLRRVHRLDISCVQLVPYQVGGSLLLGSSILIPLPESADYEVKVAEKLHAASTSKSAARLNRDKALAFIASIPHGRWAAYYDVAVAGDSPRGAMGVGSWLSKTTEEVPHVYRVLTVKGEVVGGWAADDPTLPQTIDDVYQLLDQEGIVFDAAGRASQDQRWTPEDYASTVTGPTPE